MTDFCSIFAVNGLIDVLPRTLRPFLGVNNNYIFFTIFLKNAKFLFPQCKNSIGNNSGSIEYQYKKNVPVITLTQRKGDINYCKVK